MKLRFILRRSFSLLCPFFIIGCTKTCVGLPELGSKAKPIRFYMDGWPQREASLEVFRLVSNCIEENAGYRVSFEIAADEKAVGSALGRGEADFGLMSSYSYLDASSRFKISAVLLTSENGSPSTRSVILGKTLRWKTSLSTLGIPLTSSGLKREKALSPLDTGRFVYVSPESDVGFFVPRHTLLQRDVYPEEAIFAGSYPLVLQSLQRDIALAGAVSENFIEDQWPQSTPVQVAGTVGEFTVLAISQSLPGKVVVRRDGLPPKLIAAVSNGLSHCSKGASGSSVKKIFLGDGFLPVNERIFSFIRDILEFQREHVRVLSPNEP